LWDRFKLVRLVKMLGSVRLFGNDVRLVEDRSRLIDSSSGSGSLSKCSLAGDGSADENRSDEVDDAREDMVWVSSACSNSDAEAPELVEADLDVDPVIENGIDSRDGVLSIMDVLWTALGVLSKSPKKCAELALVAEL
jgi:hypothetical protein